MQFANFEIIDFIRFAKHQNAVFKYDLNILDYNEKYQSSDIQEEVL